VVIPPAVVMIAAAVSDAAAPLRFVLTMPAAEYVNVPVWADHVGDGITPIRTVILGSHVAQTHDDFGARMLAQGDVDV
jgi:hypothetical protein